MKFYGYDGSKWYGPFGVNELKTLLNRLENIGDGNYPDSNEEQFSLDNLKDSLPIQPSKETKINDNAIDFLTFILIVYAGLFILTVFSGDMTISLIFIIITVILLTIFVYKKILILLVRGEKRQRK